MGIPIASAKLLMAEAKRRAFGGRVLQLGKQDCYFSKETLFQAAQEVGFALKPTLPADIAADPYYSPWLTDKQLFSAIGFSEVTSMDCCDFEGATYQFDLNSADVPQELVGAFDLIYDGGTIEHVFHLPNAMRSIWKMLRVGGRVIHCCPAANYVDHGFYCVSPTFFWDFYTTNHFEMNSIHVVCHTDDHIHGRRDVCVYTPGCLESVSFGGLDDRMYVTHCVATKTEASTGDRIPQQSRYAAEYEEARAKAAAASTSGLAAGSQDTGQGLASTVAAQCKSMGRTLVRAAKSTARRRVPPVYYLSRASYLWMRGQFRTNCDRVSRLRRRFWRKKKGLALEVVARL